MASAERPARVRKVARRSVSWATCGWTSPLAWTRQPASAFAALRPAATRGGVGAGGEDHAVLVAHHGAGLQEVGGAQGRVADDHARADREEAAQAVGLPLHHGGEAHGRVTEPDGVAELCAEPGQDGALDHGAVVAQGVGERARGRQLDPPEERVVGVDRLEGDGQAAAVCR